MTLEFRDHHTLGYSWQQDVLHAGLIIGHIRRTGGGPYQYFHGPHNELTVESADSNLEKLQRQVETRHGR